MKVTLKPNQKYIAEWYEENKDMFAYTLSNLLVKSSYYIEEFNENTDESLTNDEKKLLDFVNTENGIQILVNMHQYGYILEQPTYILIQNVDHNIQILEKSTNYRYLVNQAASQMMRLLEHTNVSQNIINEFEIMTNIIISNKYKNLERYSISDHNGGVFKDKNNFDIYSYHKSEIDISIREIPYE